MFFRNWFSSNKSSPVQTFKGVTYNAEDKNRIVSCIFCEIYAGRNRSTEVVYIDERVIVFYPLDEAGEQHLLVVPKLHIDTIESFNDGRYLNNSQIAELKGKQYQNGFDSTVKECNQLQADIELLSYMREVGERVSIDKYLSKLNPSSTLTLNSKDEAQRREDITGRTQFCFHVPPFNSINHLHLHVITLPFLSWKHWIKYSTRMPWCCTHQEILDSLLDRTNGKK